MNPLAEIYLVAMRELRRNLRSAKGLVASLLFLLGGTVAILLYYSFKSKVIDPAINSMSAAQIHQAKHELFIQLYSDLPTALHLENAPEVGLFVYNATLFFLPVLAMLIGYDQLAGELQHRSIRYTAIRARRPSLVVGTVLGSWLTVTLLSLFLHLLAGVLAASRGAAPGRAPIAYALQFWLAGVVYVSGYSALTSFVSGLFRTPILALMASFGSALVLWVARMIGQTRRFTDVLGWVQYGSPGYWESWMLAPEPQRFVLGALASLGIAAALVTLSSVALWRRDL